MSLARKHVTIFDVDSNDVNAFVDALEFAIHDAEPMIGQDGFTDYIVILEKFRDAFIRDVLTDEDNP